MNQADVIREAEAAIARMLNGIRDPGKRSRAKEYAAGATTIALRDAGLIDGYATLTSDGPPVLIDPVSMTFAVNPQREV